MFFNNNPQASVKPFVALTSYHRLIVNLPSYFKEITHYNLTYSPAFFRMKLGGIEIVFVHCCAIWLYVIRIRHGKITNRNILTMDEIYIFPVRNTFKQWRLQSI